MMDTCYFSMAHIPSRISIPTSLFHLAKLSVTQPSLSCPKSRHVIETGQSNHSIAPVRHPGWSCYLGDQSPFSGIDGDTLKENMSLLPRDKKTGPGRPRDSHSHCAAVRNEPDETQARRKQSRERNRDRMESTTEHPKGFASWLSWLLSDLHPNIAFSEDSVKNSHSRPA